MHDQQDCDKTLNLIECRPYDRGAADSYYGRKAQPHKLNQEGERVEQLTAAEIAEYYKGYGSVGSMDRKQWD